MHFERLEAHVDSAARELPKAGEPYWKPLEALIGPALIGQFMYMGSSGAIHLYKHGMTRKYLNLDERLNCFEYKPANDCYMAMPLAQALSHVFTDCEQLGAKPNVNYDGAFRSARDNALCKAGYRSVTLSSGDGVV